MQIRPALAADVPMLARMHVQAWTETYAGILPPDEIARRTIAIRTEQWTNQINAGQTRILLIPDCGFVQFGAQREADLAKDYPEELYCLYLLQSAQGQGQGRALFDAGRGNAAFTALALANNAPACRFYARTGAQVVRDFDGHIGPTPTKERLFGWPGIHKS